MSLHDYFFTAPGAIVDRPWVGLENFSTVLSDPDVRAAFLHVGIFIVINVPLTVIIALGLAVGLNAAIPFRGFLRAAYYIPYVTASVAVIAVWLWLFSRQGLVNTVLGPLAPAPSWLVNLAWRCRRSPCSWPGSRPASSSCWPRCRTFQKSSMTRPRWGAGRWQSFLTRRRR